MRTTQASRARSKRAVQINVRLHPVIHAALYQAKLSGGYGRLENKLHEILCHEFERPDLIQESPDLLTTQ